MEIWQQYRKKVGQICFRTEARHIPMAVPVAGKAVDHAGGHAVQTCLNNGLEEVGAAGDDCAAFAAGHVFGGVKRENRRIGMDAWWVAFVAALEAMCGILDDRHPRRSEMAARSAGMSHV